MLVRKILYFDYSICRRFLAKNCCNFYNSLWKTFAVIDINAKIYYNSDMIYLDHAAATPVDERVMEAMRPFWSERFFNPSAAYLPAKEVAAEYVAAKDAIAHAIGAKGSELVITAGATEANNLAVSVINMVDGSCRTLSSPTSLRSAGVPLQVRHPSTVLYLATEHDSVRKVAERYGGTAVAVDRNGRVVLDDLREKLSDETVLISIALVNGETGTVQPLSEVGALVREVRLDRLRRGVRTPLYLHSDASQALNLLEVNVARLGVDMMTLNSAKVYGPKGVGALFVSHEVKLSPAVVGGGQERGLRSGTENVPGVVGFAKAVELAREHLKSNRKKYAEWRQILIEGLEGALVINRKHALDNFVNLCYNGIDGERLVFLLEERGVYVATGAACAASKGVRSHVLAAMGLTEAEIAGSLRLTLGETNTTEQVREAVQIINDVTKNEYRRVQG